MVSSLIAGATVDEAVPFAPLTTLRVGPIARRLITCDTTDKVAVLRALDADPQGSVLVLAGGSNVVLADDLADLTVVGWPTPRSPSTATSCAPKPAPWDDVVVTALAHGLGGLECLSGIPGSTGATPVQNVGAYGAEVADTISGCGCWTGAAARTAGWVRTRWASVPDQHPQALGCRDRARGRVRVGRRRAQRAAALRRVAAALAAEPGHAPIRCGCARRCWHCGAARAWCFDEADHDTWSVGSFFTNPVVTPAEFDRLTASIDGPVPNYPAPNGVKLAAGWLVERAGFGKGFPGDGAPVRLSTKHALALTNRGGATAADVIALAKTVRDGVRAEFEIELTAEPALVGCSV